MDSKMMARHFWYTTLGLATLGFFYTINWNVQNREINRIETQSIPYLEERLTKVRSEISEYEDAPEWLRESGNFTKEDIKRVEERLENSRINASSLENHILREKEKIPRLIERRDNPLTYLKDLKS